MLRVIRTVCYHCLLQGLVLSAVTRPHPVNVRSSIVTTQAKALIRLLGNSIDQAPGTASAFVPSLFSEDVVLMSSGNLLSEVGTNSSIGHGREILGPEDDVSISVNYHCWFALFANNYCHHVAIAVPE